jgi:hypothetical protein
MTTSSTRLIKLIPEYNWSAEHIDALKRFFADLETHWLRDEPNGDKTLLIYQARIRRQWHDDLKKVSLEAFDIGNISEDFIRSISWEINRKEHQEAMKLVSTSSLFTITNSNLIPFPIFSLHISNLRTIYAYPTQHNLHDHATNQPTTQPIQHATQLPTPHPTYPNISKLNSESQIGITPSATQTRMPLTPCALLP